MKSLAAERPVRIPELLLLLLHHRTASSEPVVPRGSERAVVRAPLDLGVHEPLVRTVPELPVAVAASPEGIVEAGALESGPSSSGGAELGRGGKPAALIEAAAAAPRKPLRRTSLWVS